MARELVISSTHNFISFYEPLPPPAPPEATDEYEYDNEYEDGGGGGGGYGRHEDAGMGSKAVTSILTHFDRGVSSDGEEQGEGGGGGGHVWIVRRDGSASRLALPSLVRPRAGTAEEEEGPVGGGVGVGGRPRRPSPTTVISLFPPPSTTVTTSTTATTTVLPLPVPHRSPLEDPFDFYDDDDLYGGDDDDDGGYDRLDDYRETYLKNTLTYLKITLIQ